MKKRVSRLVLISSVALIIILVGLTYYYKDMRGEIFGKKVLGEAQMVVYKQGEKIVLDPNSPYYKKLQLASEELLIFSFSKPFSCEEIQNFLSPEELKKEGYAIEINYNSFIDQNKFGFTKDRTRLLTVSRIIIPLSGDLVNFKFDDSSFVVLFPFILTSSPDGKIKLENWSINNCDLVGSKIGVEKIKNILWF